MATYDQNHPGLNRVADIVTRINNAMPPASEVMFGTVLGMTEKSLTVQIDGATTNCTIVRACHPQVGDRVVILKKDTIWLGIAAIGGGVQGGDGGGGGSVSIDSMNWTVLSPTSVTTVVSNSSTIRFFRNNRFVWFTGGLVVGSAGITSNDVAVFSGAALPVPHNNTPCRFLIPYITSGGSWCLIGLLYTYSGSQGRITIRTEVGSFTPIPSGTSIIVPPCIVPI